MFGCGTDGGLPATGLTACSRDSGRTHRQREGEQSDQPPHQRTPREDFSEPETRGYRRASGTDPPSPPSFGPVPPPVHLIGVAPALGVEEFERFFDVVHERFAAQCDGGVRFSVFVVA